MVGTSTPARTTSAGLAGSLRCVLAAALSRVGTLASVETVTWISEYTVEVIPGGWLQVIIGLYMMERGYRVSFGYNYHSSLKR